MRNQASIGGKYKPGEKPISPAFKLAYGIVTQTIPSKDQLRVQLNDLSNLPACPYLKSYATTSGERIKLPAKGSLVLVGFIDGRKDSPIVLGVVRNRGSKVSAPNEGTWIDKHPSGTEIKITSLGNIFITTAGGVKIELDGEDIKVEGTNVVIKADTVKLGSDGAALKAVLGDNLKTYIEGHMHTGNLGYPTGTPTQPMPDNCLSTKITLE